MENLRCFLFFRLFRPENPVAGVAEAGDDVAVVVELLIDGSDKDINVRMVCLNAVDTLGGGDDAHELDVLAAVAMTGISQIRQRIRALF